MDIMSVEERGADTLESKVDEDYAVIVGGRGKPSSSGLVMPTKQGMGPVFSGSIAPHVPDYKIHAGRKLVQHDKKVAGQTDLG